MGCAASLPIPGSRKRQNNKPCPYLATKEYVDFGPTLASEYLSKKRGLWIGKALCANIRDTFPVDLIREQGGKKMNHEPTSELQGAMLLGRPLPPIRTARTVDESALSQTLLVLGNHRQTSRFVPVEALFKDGNFDQEIVVLCVGWYVCLRLSFRDLVAMMSERGLKMAHMTSYSPPQFERRCKCYARYVGGSWRMDETYVRVKGEWRYLYRAVDKAGKTVDFILSLTRDENAAKTFLRKAMTGQRIPTKITLDAYAASRRAVGDLKRNGELPERVRVRTSKYLNNTIEQDHRRVKQRLGPLLGLKSFRTAAIVISCIELAEKIKKGQFKISKLGGPTATMPEIWQAALAA